MDHVDEGRNANANQDSYINQLNNILFPMAECLGLLQFRYSVELDELIVLPRHLIQLFGFCVVYASLIYYDVSSGESISVAGEKSTIFNTGMKITTTASFSFSLITVSYTYIIRRRIVSMLSMFSAVRRAVR